MPSVADYGVNAITGHLGEQRLRTFGACKRKFINPTIFADELDIHALRPTLIKNPVHHLDHAGCKVVAVWLVFWVELHLLALGFVFL